MTLWNALLPAAMVGTARQAPVARVDGAACGVASTDSPVARMNTGYSPSGRRLSSVNSSCVQAARANSSAVAAGINNLCLIILHS